MRIGNWSRRFFPVLFINSVWNGCLVFFLFQNQPFFFQATIFIVFSLSSFSFARKIIRPPFQWVLLDKQNSPELQQLAKEAAQLLNAPVPQLGWLPFSQANLISFYGHEKGLILLTQGILEKMAPEEISFLIKKELYRIKKYALLDEWAVFWPCMIEKTACLISWILMISENRRELREGILAKMAFFVSDAFSWIWLKSCSVWRDFCAEDEEILNVCPEPFIFIKALKNLGPQSEAQDLKEIPRFLSYLFAVYPFLSHSQLKLVCHPSTEERLSKVFNFS